MATIPSSGSAALTPVLLRHQGLFGNIFPFPLRADNTLVLDCSENNKALDGIDLNDTSVFHRYVQQCIGDAAAAVGGYLEERVIYRRSPLFTDTTGAPRYIHLGIDLWVPAGTEVLAPLEGTVHSIQNNKGFGDYGPTLILRHELDDVVFYTLYGHLSTDSLRQPAIQPGAALDQGTICCRVGDFPENGDWPPHLHFQIIADMTGYDGDFTGVCSDREREKFRQLCPDPNLILQIPTLPVVQEASAGG